LISGDNLMNLTALILFALSVLNPLSYQDHKPTSTQPASASNQTKTESPNEVELALKEAREHGETVIVACLEKCKDSKEQIPSGVVVGRAIELKTPAYPAIARAAHASGQVRVQLLIGKDGKVVAAHAVSGHPLLQAAAVNAARESVFAPTTMEGKPVMVSGEVVYNFAAK
jgi:protein TonB